MMLPRYILPATVLKMCTRQQQGAQPHGSSGNRHKTESCAGQDSKISSYSCLDSEPVV